MLWAKMFRDLKENRGAYIACLVIIIIGLMIYTSFSMVIDNLTLSKNTFYQNQNFADGFADVQAIPFSEVSHLRDTPGIKDIQGRIVKDVQVLLPQREENVYLRLVSVDPNEANPINGVNLSQGIPLTNEESNIWIDNKFYEANKLSLNDELNIIAEGKKKVYRSSVSVLVLNLSTLCAHQATSILLRKALAWPLYLGKLCSVYSPPRPQ